MNFTDGELVFMNSITKARKLQGLKLSMPGIINKEIYIKNTMESLQKKKLLYDRNTLNKNGALYAFIFEKFKFAKKHIVINNYHLGLLANSDNVICIIKERNNSNNILIEKQCTVLMKIIHDCVYLQKSCTYFKDEPTKMTREKFLSEIKKYGKNRLHVRCTKEESLIYDKFFYWNEEVGYEYDFTNEVVQKATSQRMRLEIVNLFTTD